MTEPDVKNSDNRNDARAAEGYAPRTYTARQHAIMGAKSVLVVGLLFALLWLFDSVFAQ